MTVPRGTPWIIISQSEYMIPFLTHGFSSGKRFADIPIGVRILNKISHAKAKLGPSYCSRSIFLLAH